MRRHPDWHMGSYARDQLKEIVPGLRNGFQRFHRCVVAKLMREWPQLTRYVRITPQCTTHQLCEDRQIFSRECDRQPRSRRTGASLRALAAESFHLCGGSDAVVLQQRLRRSVAAAPERSDHAAEPPSRILCVPFALFAVEGSRIDSVGPIDCGLA
ncbi:unnamed protein product [Durusdinium trenchii]|uniref:Uncharacterized protein n=1 Tax=Durusdinium trenchii TaxID=1381693 RepID=A0ABP0PGI9_9DINO